MPGILCEEEPGFVSYCLARLFHLSFDSGLPCPYPCQCGMGGNSIAGNQFVTNILNLTFSHF